MFVQYNKIILVQSDRIKRIRSKKINTEMIDLFIIVQTHAGVESGHIPDQISRNTNARFECI